MGGWFVQGEERETGTVLTSELRRVHHGSGRIVSLLSKLSVINRLSSSEGREFLKEVSVDVDGKRVRR